jgi:ketosteroid isomerase-like protein
MMAPTTANEEGTTMDTTNQDRIEHGWARIAEGDLSVAFDMLADDVIFENGPGAGPWRLVEGKDALIAMFFGFAAHVREFHQEGHCIYADEEKAISLVHETGLGAGDAVFDNRAVYVMRFRIDGKVDRVWTVDLDTEAMLRFWAPEGSSASLGVNIPTGTEVTTA